MSYFNLSVFDLDHTLITKNSSFLFCRNLVKKGIFPSSYLYTSIYYYLRHRFFHLSLTDLHYAIFERLLKGNPIELLQDHVDAFIQEYLAEEYYFPALSRLRLAQHLGHYTAILSNSPSFLVEKVAKVLQVDAWKATEYSVDKDRKLCHISALMRGEEKARSALEIAEKLRIPKEAMTAYSDSSSDVPFLTAAGKAVAVNPDRQLLKLAKQSGWEVI